MCLLLGIDLGRGLYFFPRTTYPSMMFVRYFGEFKIENFILLFALHLYILYHFYLFLGRFFKY